MLDKYAIILVLRNGVQFIHTIRYNRNISKALIKQEAETNRMIALKNIIHTWNTVSEYNIKGYMDSSCISNTTAF